MKSFGIRARILFAALAPATLVAFLIAGLLTAEHIEQAYFDQHRRLAAVSRQISAAAEYSLFAGNNEALARLLDSAVSEPDVVAAAFLDSRGTALASTVPVADLPAAQDILADFKPETRAHHPRHWHGVPIRPGSLGEADPFSADGAPPPLIGHLLMKVSNDSLHDNVRRYALKAAAGTALMLLFGVLLALAISRGLIRTLGDIAGVIDGIRRGRHDLRVEAAGDNELGRLARGINTMADAVGQTQEALAARVAEATASLRHERDEAAAAAQARSRFFAAASHDLRQPLHALGLFATRLEREARHTPLHPQTVQIAHSANHLHELLDTLLDYSRLSGKTWQAEKKSLRATELFGRVIEELAPAAAAKRLELRHRIADCRLLTDPVLFYRILLNLIGNAVRHTHRGTVLVACRRGATHARIEVWDTGPGIPPEHLAAVFEELVQLDNPERDPAKGLGLGLAIVRRTADLLDHPLALCSRVGQGSRFSVTVPLSPAAPEVLAPDAAEGFDDPLDGARILVVAKRAHERNELADMVEAWGCLPESVGGTRAAQDWLTAHGVPDAILWDAGIGESVTQKAQRLLAKLEKDSGLVLRTIIIGDASTTAPAERGDDASCLLLARPFRAARLRALLSGLLANH